MFSNFSKVFTRAVVVVGSVGLGSNFALYADTKTSNANKIVIIGGGTAGIGVAAMLANEGVSNVSIIEPQTIHYYQPLWTLVGAGMRKNTESVKPLQDFIPNGTEWINKSATTIDPTNNSVTLNDGSKVNYDYLIVAAGIQIDWDKISGLKESIGKENSGVVSIYDYNYSDATWKALDAFKSGRVIFTMPNTLIKCAGAPQKIMWLFEEILRERGIRDQASIEFWVPGGAMFGVKKYADKLEEIRQQRNVKANFKQELIAIDSEKKIATFKSLTDGTTSEQLFDIIHVTPPMSSPDFIKSSPLANSAGWVDVDKHTLQSVKYKNVFAIGDCSSTPNSKTAAAVIGQAPILVHNLIKAMHGEQLNGKYYGYASCPLLVGKKRVILAEFGYDGKLMETFDSKTGRFPYRLLGQDGYIPERFFGWLKTSFFPFVYWNLWLRGGWYGSHGPFKPDISDDN